MSSTSRVENGEKIYEETRGVKALKTLAVIRAAVHRPLSELKVLEVGCHAGEISIRLSPCFREYSAIDLDAKCIEIARSKIQGTGMAQVKFRVMDAQNLEFSDQTFDLVICSHVYEHVSHPQTMMREISRVLRDDGICYFGAGNRLVINEPHHQLPFLSWVPKKIANFYLKAVSGKAIYEENLYSYWRLRSLVHEFKVDNFTLKIIREPEKFSAVDVVKPGSIKQALALRLYSALYWLCPTYIFILRKKN